MENTSFLIYFQEVGIFCPAIIHQIKAARRLANTRRSMSYQAIIDLNNTAVAHIQRGYYDHAIGNLTIAVTLLLQANNGPIHTSPSCGSVEFRRDPALPIKRLHRVKIGSSTATNKDVHITLGSMYCRAFLLSHIPALPLPAVNYNLLVCVVLYNLALVNHLSGVNYGARAGLTKALRLYESVLNIIHQNPRGIDMYHLTLAVTQNMGQIHSYLFQRNEATACFDCLRQLLSNENRLIPDDDFAMFFVSAMFQAQELHLAPAA